MLEHFRTHSPGTRSAGEAIARATQTKEGETQIGLKYGIQLGQQAATAAAAKAQAELPSQMTLENQKGKFQLGAAGIAANAAIVAGMSFLMRLEISTSLRHLARDLYGDFSRRRKK